jgi:hypothetical protein
MKRFLILAAVMAPLAIAALPSQAFPLSAPPAGAQADGVGLATPAGWRDRCHRWRGVCEERHPGHGWRYRRCLAAHGCV